MVCHVMRLERSPTVYRVKRVRFSYVAPWKRAGTVTERFAKPSAFGLSRFDSCRFRSCGHRLKVGHSVANADLEGSSPSGRSVS